MARIRDLGVCAVDFRFTAGAADDALRAMEVFQQDVVAKMLYRLKLTNRAAKLVTVIGVMQRAVKDRQ